MELNTILLVDDDADLRRIAVLVLTRLAGWTVITAENGVDALAKLEEGLPDLVLLDVMMPAMDGPTTLAHLRADPRTKDLPVVFMTAAVQAQQVKAWRALGAAGVVGKPFDVRTLPARLEALYEEAVGSADPV